MEDKRFLNLAVSKKKDSPYAAVKDAKSMSDTCLKLAKDFILNGEKIDSFAIFMTKSKVFVYVMPPRSEENNAKEIEFNKNMIMEIAGIVKSSSITIVMSVLLTANWENDIYIVDNNGNKTVRGILVISEWLDDDQSIIFSEYVERNGETKDFIDSPIKLC